ncbi:hypothetical protein [Vitiosangium sp. GDMCC 1.1324]|uniref:hypothetical protein n=1 Tax=Vitiosangium sp. (strain GDMCC 1.1324) TaxID=2138576 RepID=UPI000D37F780|nr:hypothetical protein [Vitiosangium sp. GDMCC 1.1324]PTL76240.1 hypothetical protein DAT35_50240 [Vitiosangium sp. GDMCC 1.1324]
MDYFLMARDDWRIQTERFVELLASEWPAVKLKLIPDPQDNHAVEFRLPMKESMVLGALNREGSAIIYYGALRDCAEFALWYQSVVPEAQPFLLFDEGYNCSIELKPETTAEEIIRALGGGPSTS